MTYDLLVSGARVVSHDSPTTPVQDIGIRDGKIVAIGDLDRSAATEVFEADGRLAFPGLVDAHQHWGIYNPLSEDAETESRACAQGGVTTGITYIRTGQYYLNRGGPYRDFMPLVLEATNGRAYVDHAFHVAPMMREHIDEIPSLVTDHGITSFKIFMFYGSHGLHGRSKDQASFLMIPEDESYDYAHFEFIMRGVEATRRMHPDLTDAISLSLHCETAEIMSAYTAMVEASDATGLDAYHQSRPPHSEGLAITIASYLAHATELPAINLLHLSSAQALEAAMLMAATFPHIDFRREVTVGHLLLDTATGPLGAKVNPPIRPREDVEAVWEHVLAGNVDWVVSDHACCRDEKKFGEDRDDVFAAKSGFGGTEYLLPGLFSEGSKRGLEPHQIARLTSWNPAQRFGLRSKGAIRPGLDADIALLDPGASEVVRAEDSDSSQGYTPFEGLTLQGVVTDVLLRGEPVLRNRQVVGHPRGRFLRRPTT